MKDGLKCLVLKLRLTSWLHGLQWSNKVIIRRPYVQGLNKIMKTPEISNKFTLIRFFDCSPPVKSGVVQLPSYSFWGNWVLVMVIKLCCNFRSYILVILPNKESDGPLSLPSKVLLQWGGFSFFLKYTYYFRDSLQNQIIQRFMLL